MAGSGRKLFPNLEQKWYSRSLMKCRLEAKYPVTPFPFFPKGKNADMNNITHVKDHKDGQVIADVLALAR